MGLIAFYTQVVVVGGIVIWHWTASFVLDEM